MEITYTDSLTVEEYNELHAAVGWEVCEPARVRMALARTDCLVAARDGERAIGMARVMHDGLQAIVMDVMVCPAYQKRGIGAAIMERVMCFLDELAEDGAIFVSLIAETGQDGFYARFGFRRHPNADCGPGMTRFLVKKA